MVTISVRVDDELRGDLEEIARAQGASVSEIIRQAIETRLGRDDRDDRNSPAPRSMSTPDRHMLALLHQILGRLDPDEADYHGSRIDVFNRGFAAEYGSEFGMVEDELTHSDCKLVWDILDMFSVIQASVAKLGIEQAALTFFGFDANDDLEGQMLAYAQYLVTSRRWTSLAHRFDEEAERGNSHMPRLAVYRRMLEVYRPIWQRIMSTNGRGEDRYVLNEAELAELVDASRYPR